MLLDTNVLIAAAVPDHQHHLPSLALLAGATSCAVATHCLSETFSNLTRHGPAGLYRHPPAQVTAFVQGVAYRHRVLALSPEQHLDAMRAYAATGGIGPRLYDHLIGHTALVHGIGTIATWNTRHMRGLFPQMRVVTPAEIAESH